MVRNSSYDTAGLDECPATFKEGAETPTVLSGRGQRESRLVARRLEIFHDISSLTDSHPLIILERLVCSFGSAFLRSHMRSMSVVVDSENPHCIDEMSLSGWCSPPGDRLRIGVAVSRRV